MEFEQVVKQRYAVKSFDGKKIPEDKVKRLFEIIRFACSSFNIQPWKIIVVEDKELKEKLAPASYNQPQITSCSHLLVFCADKDVKGSIRRLEKNMLKAGAKPDEIKGYVDMMLGFEAGMSDEQRISWAQRQVYLALGNAVNGAKYLGFDSCPMEGFNPSEYSKILNLPSNIVPTALCTTGFANDSLKPKVRNSFDEVFVNM